MILVDAFRRPRELLEQRGGSAGSPNELAAAVGTDLPEPGFGAFAAKRALESADPGVRPVRRKILVAALTVRSELEHATAA